MQNIERLLNSRFHQCARLSQKENALTPSYRACHGAKSVMRVAMFSQASGSQMNRMAPHHRTRFCRSPLPRLSGRALDH